MTQSVSEWLYDKNVCRTALARPHMWIPLFNHYRSSFHQVNSGKRYNSNPKKLDRVAPIDNWAPNDNNGAQNIGDPLHNQICSQVPASAACCAGCRRRLGMGVRDIFKSRQLSSQLYFQKSCQGICQVNCVTIKFLQGNCQIKFFFSNQFGKASVKSIVWNKFIFKAIVKSIIC